MESAKKRATYQDLLAAPKGLLSQILDGELVTSPRPANSHSVSSSVLGADLGTAFMRGRGGPGGWWILDEPELHLGSQILVPDLAGWRIERMPELQTGAFFTLTPDWICEVLSPSTAAMDRVRKMRIYLAEGISFAWLVDPELRTLEAYQSEKNKWLQIGVYSHENGDDKARIAPFDAVELELSSLWMAGKA